MEKEVRLLMVFSTSLGKKVSIYIQDPREDLTESEIKNAMDLIVEKNVFQNSVGDDLVGTVEAKIVTTDTTEYDLIA